MLDLLKRALVLDGISRSSINRTSTHRSRRALPESGFPVLHAESVAITIDVFEHVRLDGS